MSRRAIRSAFLAAGFVLAAAAAAAAGPPPLDEVFGGPFALTDQDGQPRSDAEFRGRFMLIFFGYTHCPLICPVNLAHMGRALEALGPRAARVQPIFITIDPARDRPRQLRAFLEKFDPRFIGLTGSEDEIAAVAARYRVHRRKILLDKAAGTDDYLADHGTLTYLKGPDGRFLTLFPHNTPPRRMAQVIGKYLAEEPPAD